MSDTEQGAIGKLLSHWPHCRKSLKQESNLDLNCQIISPSIEASLVREHQGLIDLHHYQAEYLV